MSFIEMSPPVTCKIILISIKISMKYGFRYFHRNSMGWASRYSVVMSQYVTSQWHLSLNILLYRTTIYCSYHKTNINKQVHAQLHSWKDQALRLHEAAINSRKVPQISCVCAHDEYWWTYILWFDINVEFCRTILKAISQQASSWLVVANFADEVQHWSKVYRQYRYPLTAFVTRISLLFGVYIHVFYDRCVWYTIYQRQK